MKLRDTLLVPAMAIALLACQNANTDPDNCQGKCDGLGDDVTGKLMPRAPSAPGTISITRNDSGWLCEVIGTKGEIVLLSDEYSDRASALNGALAIEENGVLETRYLLTDNGGSWSFTLRAGNNVELADSRTFATEAEAEAAAEAARELVAGIVQYKAALTHGARFDLGRDGADWTFELRDTDDRPLLVSQIYSRRRDAITGIESVRNNGRDAARFELLESPHRFILKAGNGEEIAESAATFETAADAQAAVDSTRALIASERVANPW
jgi:uncharacterized protein YegP (UPF0339 family)